MMLVAGRAGLERAHTWMSTAVPRDGLGWGCSTSVIRVPIERPKLAVMSVRRCIRWSTQRSLLVEAVRAVVEAAAGRTLVHCGTVATTASTAR